MDPRHWHLKVLEQGGQNLILHLGVALEQNHDQLVYLLNRLVDWVLAQVGEGL